MDEPLKGIKVAILAANGFEQIELEAPRAALDKAGAKTVLVSPERKSVQGWHHQDKADLFPVDVTLEDANADDFDALLLPGGVTNPDSLRVLPEAVEFVRLMNEQGKPIAAICHAPWLLINADLVKGKKMTSWKSVKTDLMNAGAHWQDKAVVRDGLILTSRKPDDIPQFTTAMIELFQSART